MTDLATPPPAAAAPHARLVYLLGSRRGTTYDLIGERVHLAFAPRRDPDEEGEDVIVSDRAAEADRLATIVRHGPDRYELEPARPWEEIVLNGTQRVDTRTVLRHRDSVTVRDVALQFHRLFGAGSDDGSAVSPDQVSGVRPDADAPIEGADEEVETEIVAAAPTSGDDTSGLLARLKGPAQLTRVAALASRLGALVGGIETVSEGLELRAFFQRFLSTVAEHLEGARGVVLLYDKVRGSFRRVAAAPDDGARDVPISKAAIRVVCRERSAVLSRDRLSPTPDADADGAVATEARTRSVLCVPILSDEKIYGIIHLDADGPRGFTQDDLDLVAGIAPLALIALRNATAIEQLRSRDRINAERLLTRAVLQNLAAGAQLAVPGLEVAVRTIEADEPGGDLHDVIPAAEGAGAFLFVGTSPMRGVTLALFLSAARSVLRTLCDSCWSPSEILRRLGRRIRQDSVRNVSMSGTLLYWDGSRRQLAIASAGDLPVILHQTSRGCAETFNLGGQPVGTLSDSDGPDVESDRGFSPAPGDVLVVPSQGAVRVLGIGGLSELQREVERRAGEPLEMLADALGDVLTRGARAASSDATLLVIRRPER